MEFFDGMQAISEGWGIFECFGSENGDYQLQRIDEDEKFKDDRDAWLFVYNMAHKGSNYHIQALDYLSIVNETEYDCVIRYGRKHSTAYV